MDAETPAPQLTENEGEQRYELSVDGDRVGVVAYRDTDGRRALLHTKIDPAFEGRGLGSAIVSAALDDIRARGLRVEPLCPFVRTYIERHEEYTDLVAEPQ